MSKKRIRSLWFWLGMLGMVLTMVPNVLLGEQSIFTAHDQLDGEMIAYLLQAKHLFSGDMLPEFMGGMPKTALTLPAPLCVVLFLGGNGFAALFLMQLAGRLVGFAGMYLLAKEITGREWIGAVIGGAYGILPFLPVYGLSQYGIPMLFWCVLQLRENKHLALAYGYVVLFGLNSSLVLAGFGLLGLGVLLMLWDFPGRKKTVHFRLAWLVLAGIYVIENYHLLFQILGLGEQNISHKVEYRLEAQPFWRSVWQMLLYGGQHSNGYQKFIVPVVLAALAAAVAAGAGGRLRLPDSAREQVCVNGKTLDDHGGRRIWGRIRNACENGKIWPCIRNVCENKKVLRCLGVCLGWNCLLVLAAALWDSGLGVSVRSHMGALGAFQLDRLLWITPAFWYLAVACGIALLWNLWMGQKGIRRIAVGGCLFVSGAAVILTGLWILYSGDVKSNIQKLRNPEYGLMSYSDYYAVGVMEQVRDFLEERTGKGQEEYRVVSLGIDPAAALYYGFYCLDGYSNNYPLAYKHRFREIIRPELEKSEYLADYFDNWGNRCYLFSAECPGYYTIEKGGFSFQEYLMDAEALRKMGCGYLLSAAYIQNADAQGLILMQETPFETEGSYYHIYVYEIAGSAG